jgi:hypothetical protein
MRGGRKRKRDGGRQSQFGLMDEVRGPFKSVIAGGLKI